MDLLFLGALRIPVIIIVILTLVMPRKYFGRYLGWLAMPIVLMVIVMLHPPHWSKQNVGYTLGLIAVVFSGFAIGVAIVLRFIIFRLLTWWRGKPGATLFQINIPLGPLDMPEVRWALALILTGILTAILTLFTLRVLLPSYELFWISTMIAIATAVIIWIYFGIQRLRRTPHVVETVKDAVTSPSPMTTVQLVYAGALAGFIVFLIVRTLPLAVMPAWLAHAIVIASAAALWIIPVPQPPQMKIAFASFRRSIAALLVASMAMPIIVAWRAETIAGGAPYCIQVATNNRSYSKSEYYKTAETMLDMSGLTMRSPPGKFHAALTIENWTYNWTYRKLSFVEAPNWWTSSACPRKQDFAEQLPILFAD